MLSNPLKRALQEAIHKFNEYQFGKYKAEDKAVKLRDVLRIIHPKPRNKEESELFKRILEGTLKTPETWEVYISTYGSSKKTWETIMPKMPIMATLRNLRNFAKFGCDIEPVIKKLNNERIILRSKQFPFRFYSAYKALSSAIREDEIKAEYLPIAQRLMEAVENAMEISVKNLPYLPGITFMTADNSGSMHSNISKKSKVMYVEIADLLQAIAYRISDQAITSVFGQDFAIVPVSHKSTIMDNMLKFMNTNVGHSTNGFLAFQWLLDNKVKVDRILLFSDMQLYQSRDWVGSSTVAELLRKYRGIINPKVKFYSFDLTGYGTLKVPERETYLISGWSEKVLNFIELNEKKGISAIKKVENYDPFKSRKKFSRNPSKEKTSRSRTKIKKS